MTDFDGEWFASTGVKYERADDFVEVLKKGLPEPRPSFQKKRHYPTDAGHCLRDRLFKMFGAPESNLPTLTDHLTWKMGSALGDFLAELGIRAKLTAEIDMTAEEKTLFTVEPLILPYSGRIDLPIKDPLFHTKVEFWMGPDNQVIPVEYKTIKQKGFDSSDGSDGGWASIGVDARPKKDHIMQVHHYMKFLGSPYGYVVYMNKNDQRVVAHRVYWNDNVWQHVMDEALITESYYFAGLVPKREACGHRGQIAFYQKRMFETVSVPQEPIETIMQTLTHEGKKLTRGQVEEALNDPTHTWHEKLKGLVELFTANPEYVEEKVLVAEPGDINKNQLKFPCGYKGKDGGEGGMCSRLYLCYRDQIMQLGSAKEKAIAEQTMAFQFNEGVLDLNIEELRKHGARVPALETNEAPKAQA